MIPPLARSLQPGWHPASDYGRRPDRLLALESAGVADLEWRPSRWRGRVLRRLWVRPRLHYGRGGRTACGLEGELYQLTEEPGAATCPWCRLARGAPEFTEGDESMSVHVLQGLCAEPAGCWSCDEEPRHPECEAPSSAALAAEQAGWIERQYTRGAWRWAPGPRARRVMGLKGGVE